MRRLLIIVVVGIVCALSFVSAAVAAPAVNGTFPVPGLETNNKLVAGPDGNIWVTVAGATNNVARVSPSGEAKEFELGLEGTLGIATGPEGKLWVTENKGVASFSPADPVGTVKTTPIAGIEGTTSIVTGPEHKMWVAAKGKVIRFLPSAPETQEVKEVPELDPRDVDVAGSLVVVADTGKPRIVSLSTVFAEKDYPIALEGSSQGVAGAPSGQIAFSDSGSNPEQIGLITPPNSAQTADLPGDPFGVALGSDGAFWIVQFAKGGLTRLTSTGQSTFLGGLPVESARQIAPGPNNTLWVTLVKAGEEGIARIGGLEPPLLPIPTPVPPKAILKVVTTISKGPAKKVKTSGKRAKVTFRFSSTLSGASFECALTKMKKGKETARPAFKPCKSPKTFKVRPGSYRFSVRAVGAGVAESSLASRAFRVVRQT